MERELTNFQKREKKVRDYRLVEGPLLKQILVHREAIIPITTKINVVTKKPIFLFPFSYFKNPRFLSDLWIKSRERSNKSQKKCKI